MTQNHGLVLSASRRTDIPAFYLDWFHDGIKKGAFMVKNPVTRVSKTVQAGPACVQALVFWSKNYRPFLDSDVKKTLKKKGYPLYFNFTINSSSTILEPMVPQLASRLDQLKDLAEEFGADHIAWRFDPICFFKMNDNPKIHDNLEDFLTIADKAAQLGVKKCVTSFMDIYKKIDRRLARINSGRAISLKFIDPPLAQKTDLVQKLERYLEPLGITLHLCCENQVLDHLPAGSRVRENACIDGRMLGELFGTNPDIKRDYGQRAKSGCRCTRSVDIGSYDEHPCFHNCLFCYANPAMDNRPTKKS